MNASGSKGASRHYWGFGFGFLHIVCSVYNSVDYQLSVSIIDNKQNLMFNTLILQKIVTYKNRERRKPWTCVEFGGFGIDFECIHHFFVTPNVFESLVFVLVQLLIRHWRERERVRDLVFEATIKLRSIVKSALPGTLFSCALRGNSELTLAAKMLLFFFSF